VSEEGKRALSPASSSATRMSSWREGSSRLPIRTRSSARGAQARAARPQEADLDGREGRLPHVGERGCRPRPVRLAAAAQDVQEAVDDQSPRGGDGRLQEMAEESPALLLIRVGQPIRQGREAAAVARRHAGSPRPPSPARSRGGHRQFRP
jgi:hypothetical protein